MHADQIALQLYTVRRLAADDLPRTLAAVAAAGYRSVEVAGLPPTDPADLARLLDDAGLSAIAAHDSVESLRRDWEAVADRLAAIDCTRAIVPWLPEEERQTVDGVRRFAGDLAEFGGHLAEPRDPPWLSQSRVRVRAARGDDRVGGPARDPAP